MEDRDERLMRQAIAAAAAVRTTTSPNPWVGAALVTDDGRVFTGATQPPGANHAEIEALRAAGDAAHGATLYVTLEPCSVQGRTGPCADAVIEAGVSRVLVAVEEPRDRVSGRGVARLRNARLAVSVGRCAAEVPGPLSPCRRPRP